jgi:GxxExxY protein
MADILYKELSFAVVGAALEVHKILGPGFLEAVYQLALEKELTLRKIPFQHQVELPVSYKGDLVGIYKANLIVDNKIVIEIKGISKLNASHEAQALHSSCCDWSATGNSHQFWDEFVGVSAGCQIRKQNVAVIC